MKASDRVPLNDMAARAAAAVRAVQRIHKLARGCPTQGEASVVLADAAAELGRVVAWHGLAVEPYGEMLRDAGLSAIRRAPAES